MLTYAGGLSYSFGHAVEKQMTGAETISGGCQCGAIRYRIVLPLARAGFFAKPFGMLVISGATARLDSRCATKRQVR